MEQALTFPWRSGSVLMAVLACHLAAIYAAVNWSGKGTAHEPDQFVSVNVLSSGDRSQPSASPMPAPAARGTNMKATSGMAAASNAKPASDRKAEPSRTSADAALPATASNPAGTSSSFSGDASSAASASSSAAGPAAGQSSSQITGARFDADYLQNPEPVYPLISRRFGEEGKVVLRVRVSARGLPLSIETRQSSGYANLDEAARIAVEKWRFVPAKRGTEPVEAWVLVPLVFNLKNR